MKIALIEKEQDLDPSQFDRVISFCRDGNDNVARYYSFDERHAVSEKVYHDIHAWIERQKNGVRFMYRGIDVLEAYGKRMFDFAFNVCQRIYVVEKIIGAERPAELWIWTRR